MKKIFLLLVLLLVIGCASTETGSDKNDNLTEIEFIDINELNILIRNREVKEVAQFHATENWAFIRLYDGREFVFVQPQMDWIFSYLSENNLYQYIETTAIE